MLLKARTKMGLLKKFVFISLFVVTLWVSVLTLIRVKKVGNEKIANNDQYAEKKKVIHHLSYQKMNGKTNEEDTFEVDETYEKVF